MPLKKGECKGYRKQKHGREKGKRQGRPTLEITSDYRSADF